MRYWVTLYHFVVLSTCVVCLFLFLSFSFFYKWIQHDFFVLSGCALKNKSKNPKHVVKLEYFKKGHWHPGWGGHTQWISIYTIHVWYVYLHLVDFHGKCVCKYIPVPWILWVYIVMTHGHLGRVGPPPSLHPGPWTSPGRRHDPDATSVPCFGRPDAPGDVGRHRCLWPNRATVFFLFKGHLISVHTKSVSRPRGCRRRNTKTRKRQARKREKTKTRKRRKHNPFRSTLNTNVITDLGMCQVCTPAVHSVYFEHKLYHSFGHV